MHKRERKGLLKHYDFILLDEVSLQAAFLLSLFVRLGVMNPYRIPLYGNMAVVITIADLTVAFSYESFKNVLKREYGAECVTTVKHVLLVEMLCIMYLYTIKRGADYSRIVLYLMAIFYAILTYIVRVLWKQHLRKRMHKGGNRSLLIITLEDMASEVTDCIRRYNYEMFSIAGLVIIDRDMTGETIGDIPVVANESTVSEYVCREWVDEVFVNIEPPYPLPEEMMDEIYQSGITVHLNLARMSKEDCHKKTAIEKIGKYTVLTASMNYMTAKQVCYKRGLDILGGLVGCILTGIIFVFIAPLIYLGSPGPIFFSQERVGRNGKTFRLYKFRSMYMDAEERKAGLMKDNRVKDGMMFKLDFDPRIIGNRILPNGRKKTGIGHFIRVTSIDEFPQFFNVLRGEMSPVGIRPPLYTEFVKYNLGHRARLAIKPGITGMWQVSGRSKITDFDEVVKLDIQYINEWSLWLDLKIILATVMTVLRRDGSL